MGTSWTLLTYLQSVSFSNGFFPSSWRIVVIWMSHGHHQFSKPKADLHFFPVRSLPLCPFTPSMASPSTQALTLWVILYSFFPYQLASSTDLTSEKFPITLPSFLFWVLLFLLNLSSSFYNCNSLLEGFLMSIHLMHASKEHWFKNVTSLPLKFLQSNFKLLKKFKAQITFQPLYPLPFSIF